jgi:uncharacterized repeat protein (TIGR01451 family)
MTFSSTIRQRVSLKWIAILLFTGALSLLSAAPAQAQSSLSCVANFNGLVDGNVNPVPPAQLEIDGSCVIRNFPPSNPFTSNISFKGNNPISWLVIFDNVDFTGNMSCDKSQGNYIWFTNGSISGIRPNCQNLFVPTEKINKQNPPGPPLAAIGVPFTYKMTIPVLFDPVSGTVINNSGSPNDLQNITITDDLNATGADMSFVSEKAYWLNDGTAIPHTFSNAGGALTFSNFPTVLAGRQFVVEVTVVLNDTPANVPGRQFANTAKWQFGRLIGGVFYNSLPGVWGVTPPMTIAGPSLVLTKSGPATMSQGQWGNFGLDVQNTGTSDALSVSLRDLLPNGATGGMCNLTPDILSAQVFAADGVTPVPGKPPLIRGTDYSVNYTAAPNCQLDIAILDAGGSYHGTISPNQRLIVRYRTQLDANTQNGVTLTNVAGAIQWFNGASSVTTRKTYTGPLTNGTPGVPDNQDAHSVTVALTGYVFSKTVADVTSGVNPATTAKPGDKLRYTLSFRTTNQALNNFSIVDDMDSLNALADFAPGTLTLVSTPAGADTSNTSSTGGSKGTGIIDVRNISLPVNSQAQIQFDITLKAPIANATVVTNQATLRLANGTTFAWSDDPNVNGTAPDPTVPNAEDPTRVTIVAVPADPVLVLTKSGPATMSQGQWGNFGLDVLNTGAGDAWNVSLRDLLPTGATGGMCNLTPDILSAQVFAADGVTPVSGKGPLARGTDYSFNYTAAPNCQLDIVILTAAGTIGPNQRLVLSYRTQLDANTQNGVALTNVAGAIQWFNGDSSVTGRKTYTGVLTNGTPGTADNQDAHTVTVALTGYVFSKTVADLTSGASPATTAKPGDKLRYSLLFRTTNQALNNFSIVDDMEALNAQADFAPGTLTLVSAPAGADTSNTNSTGGSKGTGVIDVRNLNLAVNSQALIQFDITLKAPIANGTVVTNQATLRLANGTTFAWSDDPNVNGTAPDPTVPNAEDPTRVTIVATVADPALVLTKSGPATMNLGQWGNFGLDVLNTGAGDAWNVSLRDLLPTGATGGMCNLTPDILSAQVFAVDGVTPVSGKGPLTRGTDYSFNYTAAPNCQLDIAILTAAGTIGPNQRLVLQYRTQLDANTQNGVALTNVAGAIQWFNGDSSVTGRKTYTGVLTNGTPGTADNQDAHTVTVALAGYVFSKTVANLTSGASPATTAKPGDKLRYSLLFRTTNQALNNFSIVDDMDALNGQADFAPGTLTLVAAPAGADTSNTNSTGGSKGTGVIDVRNLNLAVNSQALIQFDITLKTPITNGTVVTNQATLRLANGTTFAWSDDPNVNGTAADPTVPNAEDPTRVTIVTVPADPALVLTKSGPATMNLGQWGNFGLDVLNTGSGDAWNVSLRDLLPTGATGGMCNLTPDILSAQVFAVDGVTPVSGKGPLTRGTDYSFNYSAAPNCQLDIAILTAAGTIGPNQRLVLNYRTQLDANTQNGVTLTNVAGAIQWFNGDSSVTGRKTYTGVLTNGTPGTADNQDAHTVTVALAGYVFSKTVANLTSGASPATTAKPGDKLRYTLTFRTTNQGLNNFSIVDDMDALNAQADFAAGTLTLVASPAGADTSNTNSSGGSNGTGVIDVRNLSLPVNSQALIQFDITLKTPIANGTVVTNQATLRLANGTTFAWSDDPNVNGTAADPTVPNAEDPTRVTIVTAAADPTLVVTKSGPATMNLGQWGNFGLDVQNTGLGDAWNVSLRDLLPNGATGGMCSLTPDILSAQVFAADGVTPVSGKGPLTRGTDYSLNYSAAPNCQLDISILTAAGTIGPNQRLVLNYRTQLDANTQNGVTLTNVAGAIQWFNGDSSVTGRKTYTGVLTNGTPGTADNQDAHTVTVALAGYVFSKTVANLTSGANPATTAKPGDKLRYSLLFRTTNQALNNFSIVDDMEALNAQADFAPGTLTLVAAPAGADTSNTNSSGGSKGTGVIDIRNLSLAVNSQALIQFDITLKAAIPNATVVSNQATLRLASGTTFAWSDDPNVNGTADPTVPNAEDPTRVTIVSVAGDPALVLTKSGPATMNIGQWGNFGLDVQNTGTGDAWNVTLRDLLPNGATGGMCNLTPDILSAQVFASDGVTPVSGKGPLVRGSDYSFNYTAAPNCQLDIAILTAAGTIGPNQRLVLNYRTQLDANTQNGVTLTNVAGAIQWFNGDSSIPSRKTYTGVLTNGTPGTADNQDAHTVTVALAGYVFSKTVANLTSSANPATTASPGDKLRYTLVFRTTNQALNNFSIVDDMDALNAQADFAAGTLTLVTTPAGADTSATSSTGGTKGTGIIDIRNLSLPVNSQAQIQFDITLKAALANGTIVSNQATLHLANGTTFAWSDDPNVNGTADPTVPNAEDPTRVTITSSSVFSVQKISTYLRDPNVLLAGDTMRYTITVKNISNANAVNVVLRDAVPANTAYVAGSTTLNGAPIADAAGVSPIVNGMRINSPADPTPGSMPVDNVATITFNVVVNPTTPDGTIISNQGFVSATGIADQPSDDPRTPVPNDPTRDIVSSRPSLYAEKKVALFTDLGTPGVVDPGDVLRYTITIKNSAASPANGAVLTDPVPANTTYVANSTLLNGSPVGQPDGGAAPLASGISIGTIAAGATAVLQYDLRVNLGTLSGTAISNQAVVSSTGQPNLLTDSDGNPANGPQPTVVIVGASQQISISAQVSVVGGGPAVPGAQLDYVMNIVNTAAVPALSVVVTDDLNGTQPGQLAYVNGSATVNGSPAGVSFAGSTITANYGAASGPLAAGAVAVLRFRATLSPGLALGTVVTNTGVATWNNPTQATRASVSISIVVGSVPPGPGGPSLAALNGAAWYDANFDNVQDSRERVLTGWTVELYRDSQLSQSVQTDSSGVYRINGVDPNDSNGAKYELRFRAPGAGANTAMLGRGVSQFTNGLQRISDIIVPSGANLQGLNLAIHPNGVIYNSMSRTPVAGAALTLLDARGASPLPAGCFDDAAQQGQITLTDGYYKFDINFSDPACTSGSDYLIGVTPPAGTSYVAGYSQIIPPSLNPSSAAFSVPSCPGSSADAIPATTSYCEVQPSEFAPAASVSPRTAGTAYYVRLMLDSSQVPGSSQIFNNHIPLDPQIIGLITVTKTTPLVNVTRGQLVPYTITANNRSGLSLSDVSIVDRLPAGFSYIKGSALLDGVPAEPSIVGLTLNWNGLVIAGNQVRTVKVLLAVGAGVSEGEFVNRAQALNAVSGSQLSGEATATVRLVPDPTFDCTDVMGKVFNDKNRNGRQDDGEEGLPGVRVVTPQGLQATTDQYGRYHVTCAITPNESRGANFVMKLDDRTLPSGYRMTTDQVQIQRATSGKALQVNFGASIHRVVSIDLLDAAFEPGTTDIRVQWKSRLNLLLEELRKAPAVLRLSYVADTEDAALVKRRVEAVKRQLNEAWGSANDSYVLTIEPEVFWRRGAPPKQPEARLPGSSR